jgi:DNA-binding beta-propeller fold protein YncE
MLDARSGALLGRAVVGHIAAGIAVDERTSRAFVYNCADGTVSVVDTRTGAVLATRKVGPPGTGTFQVGDPVVVDARRGRVFVMHVDELYTLDALTGAKLAEATLPDSALSMALDRQDGRVFATAADGTLSMLDAHSGRLLRAVKLGPGVLAADERTGRIFLARSPVGARLPFSGPQRLVLLDGRTGAEVRGVALASPSYALAVDRGGTRLVVATVGPTDEAGRPRGYGSVQVFDARTLAVQGRVQVGVLPGAIAPAGRAGRVFVLNTAADPATGLPVQVQVAEGLWTRVARAVRGAAPWLGLAPPRQALSPPTGSLSVLDLARL